MGVGPFHIIARRIVHTDIKMKVKVNAMVAGSGNGDGDEPAAMSACDSIHPGQQQAPARVACICRTGRRMSVTSTRRKKTIDSSDVASHL